MDDTTSRAQMIDQAARLLEGSGLSPAQARAEAERMLHTLANVGEGVRYGGQWPEDLARLWGQASRSGARRLVLEITAEGDTRDEYTGHLNIAVLARDDWDAPNLTPRPRPAPLLSWPELAELADMLADIAGNLPQLREEGWTAGTMPPEYTDGEALADWLDGAAQMPTEREHVKRQRTRLAEFAALLRSRRAFLDRMEGRA